jgi:acyl-CoA synthetase (AMP-forming)/AMP-acid ligase II
VKTVLVASLNDFLPARPPAGKLDSFPGIPVVAFMDALQNMSDDSLQVEVNPEDPCLMMYTGGTTGSPKGAILTHNNVVHHMVQMSVWTGAKMGEDVGLSAFPLFHQAGNFLAMWAMPLATSQVLIPNPRDLQFIISAIKKFRPTEIKKREALTSQEVTLKDIVNRKYQDRMAGRIERKPVEELISNFHWVIMRARRLKKLTQEQVAQKIGEPESAVKLAEQGIFPDNWLLCTGRLIRLTRLPISAGIDPLS